MSTLFLTPEHIWLVTSKQSLFDKFKFFEPMRAASISVHDKLAEDGCAKCLAALKAQARVWVSNAFVALVSQESLVKDNCLPELKRFILDALHKDVDIITFKWKKGETSGELTF